MNEEYTKRLRVVMAEPFQQVREIFRDILIRSIGVDELLDAKNGEEALGIIEDFPPDLIIADSTMKPLNGIEMTKIIRSGKSNIDPLTPILITSGRAEVGEIIAARDAGAQDYIAKPVSAKILELRLRSAVEHPRPFVRSDDFFGPDRRRHDVEELKIEERRLAKAELIEAT